MTLDTPAAVEGPPDGAARPGRIRAVAAGVLGVLAVVVLTVGTFAVWARVTAFDGDRVSAIVEEAIAEPELQAALADYLTAQVFAAVDVDEVLTSVLPGALARLEPLIASGAQTALDAALNRVLSNPDVQGLLGDAVERAHGRAMQLLQGDGLADGIAVSDGTITLNLLPLVGRGIELLQQRLGLFGDLDVPELTASGDPAEQIAALSAATGRELPDDFGQLVVYESDRVAGAEASVESAQRLVTVAKRGVWLLVVAAVVLVAATVLVARQRWRATLLLGLGTAAAMVVARAAVHRVVDEAPNLASRPGGRTAIDTVLRAASESLLRATAIVLLVGLAAAAVGLFRRGWRRADLVLVAAVAAGAAVVAVVGLTVVSVLVAVVVVVVVLLVARRLLSGEPPPAAGPSAVVI